MRGGSGNQPFGGSVIDGGTALGISLGCVAALLLCILPAIIIAFMKAGRRRRQEAVAAVTEVSSAAAVAGSQQNSDKSSPENSDLTTNIITNDSCGRDAPDLITEETSSRVSLCTFSVLNQSMRVEDLFI